MQEKSFLEKLKEDLVDLSKDNNVMLKEQKNATRWFAIKVVLLAMVMVYLETKFPEYKGYIEAIVLITALFAVLKLYKNFKASIISYRERRDTRKALK